jgi:hemolysin activation/secretion protein
MFAIPTLPAHVPAPAEQAARQVPLAVESHGYRYTVSGNTLLADAEIRAVLHRAATPEAAVAALRRAYTDKGYFLVAVAAGVQGHEIQVRVTQGRLAHVEGPAELAAYFDGLLGRDALRTPEVVRRGLLAQADAATDGEQPKISFEPAAEPGASTLRIDTTALKDSRTVSGSATVGNLGNRYAGHDLAQVQGQLQGHGYTLQATHTRALTGIDQDSRGAYYAATSATLAKVTPAGWFQLDGSTTRYRLGVAFAPLDPGGTVKVFGGGATQLLFADDARRWTLVEGLHRIHDRETVFDGAYALRDQRYDVLDVGSQASWRLAGLAGRTASVSLAGGMKFGGLGGGRGFGAGPGTAAEHFGIYTARAGVDQALGGGYSAQLDLSAQTTPDTLPSYEQWVLGGWNALAAWLPGTLVGDRGYLGRFTVQAPSWRLGGLKLQPALFAETGAARYHADTAGLGWQRLGDAGASLGLELPRLATRALLAYAHPLGSSRVPEEQRRRQRAHAFFYLQVGL